MMKKNKCQVEDCKNERRPRDSYCNSHATKVSMSRFLSNLYKKMRQRVQGIRVSRDSKYWIGKPILAKDIFLLWSKNHPDFLRLYKEWKSLDYDRKFTPSVNRINSAKGYSLDNLEWLTTSQNCSLASVVKKMKNKEKQMVYELLGVKNNDKEK